MAVLNTTFCPQFRRFDNYCYCSTEDKLKYPKFCDVECVNENFPDNTLPYFGCQCRGYLGGPRCERTLCHHTPSKFYDRKHYQLFCIDGYDFTNTSGIDWKSIRVDENCTNLANLGARTPADFPLCPCLNDGNRPTEPKHGNITCQCVKGYAGSLCQVQPTFHRPSAVPTIAVICFLSALFVMIGVALWFRSRKTKKMYAKMYQLDPVVPSSPDSNRVTLFGPLKRPSRTGIIEDEQAPTTPGTAPKSRRGTLSALFAGRHQHSAHKSHKKSKQKQNVPTVFEGQEDQGESGHPAPAYEAPFGTEPQHQSAGVGMGLS